MSQVERIEAEPIPLRTKPVFAPMTQPTPEPQLTTQSNVLLSTFESLLPVFAALTSILAIRLYLLFAVGGAFVLAYAALNETENHSLYVLIAYCVFTILPLAWLDLSGKRKG